MRTIAQFIEEQPDFFDRKPDLNEYWTRVQRQASRHMRRLQVNALYDIARPNESDEIKDYRDNVRRDITIEGTWSWISKVSRIFVEHGITLDQSTVSDSLKEWLASGPFRIAGRAVDMTSFIYELILPLMLEDPNGVILPLPTVPDDPMLAPIKGVQPNEQVYPINIIVPSGKIRYISNEIFAWVAGDWKIDDKNTAPYYFVVDHEQYVRYIPVKRDNSQTADRSKRNRTGFDYEIHPWYPHEMGELPINVFGGVISRPGDIEYYEETKSQYNEVPLYYESFLRNYFELSDEVVIAFSDNQAVRLQHNYPKMVMAQIPCPNSECKGGNVANYLPDGTRDGHSVCPTCHGKEYIDNPGPYNVLVREDGASTGITDNRPTLEFVTPPTDILKHSYEVPWDLFTRAKRTVGLDLLENVNESGVAKALRLGDLNDILRKVAHNFFNVISRHLGFVEALLIIEEDQRKKPRLRMPTDLQYRSQDMLEEEAKEALPADRFQAQMDFYSKKYISDPVLHKVYELTLSYAPILLNTQEEIKDNLAWGVYQTEDLFKKDHAFIIFKEMSESMDDGKFMLLEKDAAFRLADAEIAKIMPRQPASVSDFNPNPPDDPQTVTQVDG